MKRVILVIISTLFIGSLLAQKSETGEVKRIHEFGVHAGTTTAVGLSYRYWPGKLGVQLTLLPVKTKETTFISMGLTGLYSFYDSRIIRFFAFLGNNVTIDNNKRYDYTYSYYPYDNTYKYNETFVRSTKYNIGFGPGFGFGSRVRINIMAGYGFYDVLEAFDILPTGEIGLYFRL